MTAASGKPQCSPDAKVHIPCWLDPIVTQTSRIEVSTQVKQGYAPGSEYATCAEANKLWLASPQAEDLELADESNAQGSGLTWQDQIKEYDKLRVCSTKSSEQVTSTYRQMQSTIGEN